MRLTHFLKESKGIKACSAFLLIVNIYAFGYLAGYDENKSKIWVFESKNTPIYRENSTQKDSLEVEGKPLKNLVASKSGTRIYYVWCSGVSRIKPENKVYFDTVDDALKQGYKLASNCPGMENVAQ
jgi:hypothetical protein